MSGGPVEFRFKGDASDAVDAVGRMGLSVERVEGKIKKMGDEAKRAKGALRESADAGEKGFAAVGESIGVVITKAGAMIAAFETARRALMALDEEQKRVTSQTDKLGSKFTETLSGLGLSNRAGFLEERIRGMVSGPGGIGGKIEDTFAPLTAYERAGGQAGTLAGFNRFEKIMKAADAANLGAGTTGFVESTQRLMNVDKNLSVEGAMGRAMLMAQAGVTDAGGYIERMGGNVDTATALAVLAKQGGQDIGVVEKIAARIQGIQSDGRKMIDVGGRKVADPATAGLFDASGAAIPLDEALRKFFGGEMPGLEKSFMANDRSGKLSGAMRALVGRGNLQSALNRARNAEGVMGGIASDYARGGGLVGAWTNEEFVQDRIAGEQEGEIRRGMDVHDRERRRMVAWLREQNARAGGIRGAINSSPTILSLQEGLLGWANLIDDSPYARHLRKPGDPDPYGVETAWGAAGGAPPRARVTAPAGYEVQVKIVKGGEAATPDAN